jgi:hypothetical protein
LIASLRLERGFFFRWKMGHPFLTIVCDAGVRNWEKNNYPILSAPSESIVGRPAGRPYGYLEFWVFYFFLVPKLGRAVVIDGFAMALAWVLWLHRSI